MLGSWKVFVAGLVLAFCVGAAGIAFAVEKEPVSGGLHALPVDAAPAPALALPPAAPALPMSAPPAPTMAAPPAAPAPEPVPAATGKWDDTSWGLLLRGGYFGVPNFIADELFTQHPDVAGSSIGAEIRYHGEEGGRGVSSIGLSVDYATASADGDWQESASKEIVTANGEVSMLAFTITGYWSMLPSWYVHPYVGIGIGVAHAKGFYNKVGVERVDADVWAPVLHIPVGLAFELGKTFQLALEGRFLDGIAIGGAFQVRF